MSVSASQLERAYQWSACGLVLVATGVWAVAAHQADEGSALHLAWLVPLLVTGWHLSAARGFRLPRAAVNALLCGALAYAVLRARSAPDVARVAELVVFLMVIKIGDRRVPRDDAQILMLAVFLGVAAMLTATGLLVGVLLVAALPLLVATAMLYQLRCGAIAARGGTPASDSDEAAGPSAVGIWHMLGGVLVAALVGILATASVVFVIVPRGVGENVLGYLGRPQARSARIGFTERVTLGERGVISESPRVVFTIQFREGGETVLGSDQALFYLRGAVLDVYHNGTWLPSRQGKAVRSGMATGPGQAPVPVDVPAEPMIEQIVHVPAAPPPGRPMRIFALWRPVWFDSPRRGTLTVIGSDRVLESVGEPGPVVYRVYSATADPPGEAPPPRRDVDFPSPAVRQLAGEILRTAGIEPDPARRPPADNARAAREIQRYFLRPGQFQYALEDHPPADGRDPVEAFLFETRTGHCEYFAAAMVALCRSVGINARMVTGYVAAEYNPASGHYVVRESNAHAWVEVEVGLDCWRTFDPTPPAGLARHRAPDGLLARVRQMFDALEYAWNRAFVGFDERSRRSLLAPARIRSAAVMARLDRWLRQARQFVMPLGTARGVSDGLVVGVVAAIVVGLLAVWRRWPRRRPPDVAAAPRSVSHPRVYRRILTILRRLGYPKPPWRPLGLHARFISDPALSELVRSAAEVYYRARFGTGTLSPDQQRLLDTLVRAMRATRRKPAVNCPPARADG